jgi:hypothetical protein
MTTEDELNLISKIFEAIDGPIIEKEGLFLYEMAKKVKNGVIVEIGSAHGRSTTCLAKGSKAGYGVKIYSIDPHAGGMYTPDPMSGNLSSDGTPDIKYYTGQGKGHQTFCDNIKKFGVEDIVVPIVEYSELAYKNFDNGHGWNNDIGLLWIDGDHRYNYVKIDIDLWAKHVVSGGTIIFHDYGFPGVNKGISHILENPRYYNFKGPGQSPITTVTAR